MGRVKNTKRMLAKELFRHATDGYYPAHTWIFVTCPVCDSRAFVGDLIKHLHKHSMPHLRQAHAVLLLKEYGA